MVAMFVQHHERISARKSIKTEDLIVSLQRFVTQSTLAEFENRLKLLYVFHCHATHLCKTSSRGNL